MVERLKEIVADNKHATCLLISILFAMVGFFFVQLYFTVQSTAAKVEDNCTKIKVLETHIDYIKKTTENIWDKVKE